MMTRSPFRSLPSQLIANYGMLLVLMALCVYYSIVTWSEQHPADVAAAQQLAREIIQSKGPARVFIAVRDNAEDSAFADALEARLAADGAQVIAVVKGQPGDARRRIESVLESGGSFDVIAANHVTATWSLFDSLGEKFPPLTGVPVMQPRSYGWPNFLKPSNLLNIANQVAVIAILAIGMTIVIVTGGIDLSVGSLIALSAIVATLLIRDYAGAESAGAWAMVACSLAGVAACGLIGAFSGMLVAQFRIPSFIVTLSMMLVARGVARILAADQSIYQVPDSFVWLGRQADLFGLPNAVVLMLGLYIAAHMLMTWTPLGRYIYAVGGNAEAARLSGVRVGRVLLFAYVACGSLAGLGGIVLASQLKSGSPTYGLMYELSTIAAVVVGGTSLAGGKGSIFGTIIGVFIIAVIQNGMNLTGVKSEMQMVVLGLVILGAVWFDELKRRGWSRLRR